MVILISIVASVVAIAAVLIGVHFILKARAQTEAKSPEVVASGKYKKFGVLLKYDKITRLTVTYSFLGVICLSTLFPFFWMLATSLKTVAEATNTTKIVFFSATPQWNNYVEVFSKLDILAGLKNTLLIEVATIPVSTFASALVAFAFAKMKLPYKTFWLLFLMSGLMIPYASVLLPQYKIYLMLNLTNTLWPLILPALFGNISLVFFFIQFMKGIPNEIFEAAKLDGAGYFKSFCMIMLPNMLLPMCCQVVFMFVSNWNDFFGPSIYLTSDATKTLQVKLYSFATNANKPLLYAGAFITCIPLFVVYMCFQKFFVGSLAITGIKG